MSGDTFSKTSRCMLNQASRIAELEAQRAELLAALERALPYVQAVAACCLPAALVDGSQRDLQRVRAAIRRAEGGAK